MRKYRLILFTILLLNLNVLGQTILRSGWTTTTDFKAALNSLGGAPNTNSNYKAVAIGFKAGRFFSADTGGGEQSGFLLTSDNGIDWHGAENYPVIPFPVRNGGLCKVGNLFAYVYSANDASADYNTRGHPTNGVLWVGTNLIDWPFKTNLSFALTGENLNVTNANVWVSTQPLIIVDSNVWFTACYGASTNVLTQSANFVQRIRTCPLASFPQGPWTTASNIVNATGVANMIDLNFYEENNVIYGIYKDDTTHRVKIGKFMNRSPLAPFTNVNNDVFGIDHIEGAAAFKLPNKKVGIVATMYQLLGYPNNRDGNRIVFSMADSITSTFSSLTNVFISGQSIQGFGPLVVESLEDVTKVNTADKRGGIAGDFVITPRFGPTLDGMTVGGMSSATNDYSALFFADRMEHEGGIGAGTNGVITLFARDNSSFSSDVPPYSYWRAKGIFDISSSTGMVLRSGIDLNVGGNFNTSSNITLGRNIGFGGVPSRHTSTTQNGSGIWWSNSISGIMGDNTVNGRGIIMSANIVRLGTPGGWFLQDSTADGWFIEAVADTAASGFYIFHAPSGSTNLVSFTQFFNISSSGTTTMSAATINGALIAGTITGNGSGLTNIPVQPTWAPSIATAALDFSKGDLIITNSLNITSAANVPNNSVTYLGITVVGTGITVSWPTNWSTFHTNSVTLTNGIIGFKAITVPGILTNVFVTPYNP